MGGAYFSQPREENGRIFARKPPPYIHLCMKLSDAIRMGSDVSIIQTLLLQGADVNAREHQGLTPLLLACGLNDYEDQVMLLINAGADVNYSITNYTPLHYMVNRGCNDAIKLLAKKGADLNAHASTGNAPLLRACSIENMEAVELLANLGADVTCCKANKVTALHYAARFGWPIEIVRLLLRKGADVNARDHLGLTPLHFSCKKRHKEIVEHLVKAGADTNVEDEFGDTPLRILIDHDNKYRQSPHIVELIKFVIAHGAFIEDDDYYNMSKKTLLKEGILQDIKICSHAIVTKFNLKDLPLVHLKFIVPENMLPGVEFMEIGRNSRQFKNIELGVEQAIQRRGYCNILDVPCVLSMMCVKSLIDYCKTMNFY